MFTKSDLVGSPKGQGFYDCFFLAFQTNKNSKCMWFITYGCKSLIVSSRGQEKAGEKLSAWTFKLHSSQSAAQLPLNVNQTENLIHTLMTHLKEAHIPLETHTHTYTRTWNMHGCAKQPFDVVSWRWTYMLTAWLVTNRKVQFVCAFGWSWQRATTDAAVGQ